MKPKFVNCWRYLNRREKDVIQFTLRLGPLVILQFKGDYSDRDAELTVMNFRWEWWS